MNNVILTDVDGVLLNWFHSFRQWMKLKGYEVKNMSEYDVGGIYGIDKDFAKDLVNTFNSSVYVSSLPPYKDAVKYVRKLHEEHGFVLHCITAIPNTPEVRKFREDNLKAIFGPTVVERLECTGTSKAKLPILAEYADSGVPWIEDKVTNATMGLDLGLDCYLMVHDHNENYDHHDDLKRIENWKELYEILT